MNAGRLDLDGVDALRAALSDAAIVARYESKIVTVPDADCMFWSGAVSGRGHGRFWLGDERVVIAHRFGFALACGVDALVGIEVLGHRCDNPLCQRAGPGHVVASSYVQNRREWAARRLMLDSPLNDSRGSRGRARELRDLARVDPARVAAQLADLRRQHGHQLVLW